jgi:hypothetical protein
MFGDTEKSHWLGADGVYRRRPSSSGEPRYRVSGSHSGDGTGIVPVWTGASAPQLNSPRMYCLVCVWLGASKIWRESPNSTR